MTKKTFTLTENTTGKSISLEQHDSSIGHNVVDISKIANDFNIFTYDVGFGATACCGSSITYIDGVKGVLQYRGIPIEQLAEKSNYIEIAYLLLFGQLPNANQLSEFNKIDGLFTPDAHPMAMIIASLSAMAADTNTTINIHSKENRDAFCIDMIGKILPIASAAFRYSSNKEFIPANNQLQYCGNLVNMFFGDDPNAPLLNPITEKAVDVLFMLHADHEQNCSTSSVRLSGSSGVNPYAAIAAGVAALWGPAHGGANEAVINMLEEIGTIENIPTYLNKAKDKNDPFRLMGFGHRVYKNYDPRATIIRQTCHEILASVGQDNSPLLSLAIELEKIALNDEYFKSKNLYPNVDFYSGIIYKALNIPANMFTVMFTIARVSGWVSHWKEMMEDSSSRIGRPRQLYAGEHDQNYKDMSSR